MISKGSKEHIRIIKADIRNPLRYLLVTERRSAAYQKEFALLLIQASLHLLLIAPRN